MNAPDDTRTAKKSGRWWPFESFGNMAQWGSVVVAVVGLSFIYQQVGYLQTTSHRSQQAIERAALSAREASARDLYLSYMEKGYQYPEFVKPTLSEIQKDPLHYARYKIYVGHLLFAYDELLEVLDDPEWILTFELDVAEHLDFLCSDWPLAEVGQYYAAMRGRIRNLIVNDGREACRAREDWKALAPPDYAPLR